MMTIRRMVSMMFFAGMMCIGMNTYATNVTPLPTNQTEKPPVVKETATVATTPTAPKVEEQNYVRITQPSLKDEIQTFDSQMNIMGEATVGTEITIIVYYGEEVESYLSETIEKDEYTLKTVGATQTFSQLINLRENQNNVVIKYQYPSNGAKGTLTLKIFRKPESEREMIKSYINPQAIVDKIVVPAPTEKTGPTQTTAPVSK